MLIQLPLVPAEPTISLNGSHDILLIRTGIASEPQTALRLCSAEVTVLSEEVRSLYCECRREVKDRTCRFTMLRCLLP